MGLALFKSFATSLAMISGHLEYRFSQSSPLFPIIGVEDWWGEFFWRYFQYITLFQKLSFFWYERVELAVKLCVANGTVFALSIVLGFASGHAMLPP